MTAPGGLYQPAPFWDHVKQYVFGGHLSQPQMEGIISDLTLAAGTLPLCWLAYCLATDFHETNQTMQPVREAYWLSEGWRKKHLRYYPWYGRGKVQLTWEKNYQFATDRLTELGFKVDLISDPEQALDLKVSSTVLVIGMLEGWFTGKKLRDFIPAAATRSHYTHARQIINGLDKADLIAGYAIEFENGLRLGDWR